MIENELRNLEKIKARQKREVKLLVEGELKAQEIQKRNAERMAIAKEKEVRRAAELAEKARIAEQAKLEKEAYMAEKAKAEQELAEQRKQLLE